MSNLKDRVRATLAGATRANEYHAAKWLACGLKKDEQFEVVDDFIACRRRLEAVGVL